MALSPLEKKSMMYMLNYLSMMTFKKNIVLNIIVKKWNLIKIIIIK